ncbi:EI24 domain-containing protein [Actinoallomurus rhizosphaericola]|uniref:EI24 domain-containing protein n=1 Tax=Actinoallomurus rhizosphaericola TaxID=2952536 RepID=UPI002092D437|nr:EI24 domain-containing protein [Actinoallomurus rhizosphaericola]MCO5997669.1 EI24 domain-containing protein [Actinoallomurus rhizosphaericola]
MRDSITGVRYFLRGMAWVARRPRQWLFGLIPALIVLAVYVVALVFLANYDWDLAKAMSPFADHWSKGARDATRGLIAVLLFGAAVMIAIVTFTAVTLIVGDPFYESLSGRVEESEGGLPPEVRVPLLRQLTRAIADGLVVGAVTTLFAVLFFVLGLLPAVGQTVVPVIAAFVSGYFLTFELTSIALERRGVRRRERFALLRRHRGLSLGFGVSVFVTFLIPLGSVLAMPGAVAGGTLLARERLVGPGIPPDQGAIAGTPA